MFEIFEFLWLVFHFFCSQVNGSHNGEQTDATFYHLQYKHKQSQGNIVFENISLNILSLYTMI